MLYLYAASQLLVATCEKGCKGNPVGNPKTSEKVQNPTKK